ncbi:MAG: serine/threonine protein kinase [Vulcanimicrobiota bacterium]
MTELAPGTLLEGRYTIVERIASGGMSTVYEVRDRRLPGRLVAKQMRHVVLGNVAKEQLEQLFRREAEVLSRLSHPNLPKVTDYFESDGHRYLVEEFVEGKTLEARARANLKESQVVGWALQICGALQYLHDHGIIYRDLKPSNVMVTDDDDIRLIDFGLVRFYTLGKAQDTVIMGTPGYAAPEQYGMGQTDPRSDIFSLGALMHHLLTGHDPSSRPFVFAPPRQLNPLVSEHIDFAVRKAVQTDPELRFESAEAMEQALRGQRPVPPQGERFAFGIEAESPRSTVAASLACLGAGAFAWMVLGTTPVTACVTLGFTPLWLLTLWRRYFEQKRLARTVIRLERDGIVLLEGGDMGRWTWNQVNEVRFEHRRFDLTPMLVIKLGERYLRLPIGPPEVLENLSELRGLIGADRLSRVIIDRANLELSEPGGRIYR